MSEEKWKNEGRIITNDLTKKNYQWHWEASQQDAFEELKHICTKEIMCP
jgi:hypothetical protein